MHYATHNFNKLGFIMQSIQDFGRVKVFTAPPPPPPCSKPEGPICLLVQVDDTGLTPDRSREHAQGVRTRDLPGTGTHTHTQLMSEPFPRDKVEMTRNMSCREATSLQHDENTWLNLNYNLAKTCQAQTRQHSSDRPKRQMSVLVLAVQFWLWCYLLDAPWSLKLITSEAK